jgi:hypothetical protein
MAIDALQARETNARSVVVVHTDLAENDFTSLFETVADDPGSYGRPGTFTYAAGHSFYDRLFPDASLSLAWSATAPVWLRTTPCELPDHLFSYAATGEPRAVWQRAAADDWRTFLDHRAHELREGGQLVVNLPVAGPDYLEWMGVVEGGARDARDRGIVTPSEFAAMVIPTYLSTVEDVRKIVEDVDGLALEESEVAMAPDPAYASFREHGDPERYATETVELFRAWSEPSLVACLDTGRDPDARTATANAFFGCVRDALASTPTQCDWSVGLLRIRRS